jgi:hypothetical protein
MAFEKAPNLLLIQRILDVPVPAELSEETQLLVENLKLSLIHNASTPQCYMSWCRGEVDTASKWTGDQQIAEAIANVFRTCHQDVEVCLVRNDFGKEVWRVYVTFE